MSGVGVAYSMDDDVVHSSGYGLAANDCSSEDISGASTPCISPLAYEEELVASASKSQAPSPRRASSSTLHSRLHNGLVQRSLSFSALRSLTSYPELHEFDEHDALYDSFEFALDDIPKNKPEFEIANESDVDNDDFSSSYSSDSSVDDDGYCSDMAAFSDDSLSSEDEDMNALFYGTGFEMIDGNIYLVDDDNLTEEQGTQLITHMFEELEHLEEEMEEDGDCYKDANDRIRKAKTAPNSGSDNELSVSHRPTSLEEKLAYQITYLLNPEKIDGVKRIILSWRDQISGKEGSSENGSKRPRGRPKGSGPKQKMLAELLNGNDRKDEACIIDEDDDTVELNLSLLPQEKLLELHQYVQTCLQEMYDEKVKQKLTVSDDEGMRNLRSSSVPCTPMKIRNYKGPHSSQSFYDTPLSDPQAKRKRGRPKKEERVSNLKICQQAEITKENNGMEDGDDHKESTEISVRKNGMKTVSSRAKCLDSEMALNDEFSDNNHNSRNDIDDEEEIDILG